MWTGRREDGMRVPVSVTNQWQIAYSHGHSKGTARVPLAPNARVHACRTWVRADARRVPEWDFGNRGFEKGVCIGRGEPPAEKGPPNQRSTTPTRGRDAASGPAPRALRPAEPGHRGHNTTVLARCSDGGSTGLKVGSGGGCADLGSSFGR